MKKFLRLALCFICSFFIFNTQAWSQITEPSYTLTPLVGKYIDSTNPKEIVLVFKHLSKSRIIEKLTISGKLSYTLGADTTTKIEYLGQGPNRHTVAVADKNIGQRMTNIYDLIKDNPAFSLDSNMRYIIVTLRNITDKYVDRMTFTYGLWEPADDNIRFETKHQIAVEK